VTVPLVARFGLVLTALLINHLPPWLTSWLARIRNAWQSLLIR
jgi:hypothetical protein